MTPDAIALASLTFIVVVLTVGLIAQSRQFAAERRDILDHSRAQSRQNVRASLSRTAREYEQAEAVGHAIEENARRNHITEDEPPYEGFG